MALKQRAMDSGNGLLKRLQKRANELGFSAETELLEDKHLSPCSKDTILDYLTESQPSMLVCGSRGMGPMSRLLIGSVSDYLVHNAPCSVVVVKPTREPNTIRGRPVVHNTL